MRFEIIGEIRGIETFAVGRSIRELPRLQRIYGKGRWRKRKGFARVRLPGGVERQAEIHWYEATGIGRNSKSSGFWKTEMNQHFAICIDNEGYLASLERRKLYEVIPDADAESLGQLQVKDESGEDYLYPKEFFVLVDIPSSTERALISAA